jgi:hypothetical protein
LSFSLFYIQWATRENFLFTLFVMAKQEHIDAIAYYTNKYVLALFLYCSFEQENRK